MNMQAGAARLPSYDSSQKEHIWHRVFYVGTEWQAVPAIEEFDWTWNCFDKYMAETVRPKLQQGWYCYIWGATEPKFVQKTALESAGQRRPRLVSTASGDDADSPDMVILPVLNVICLPYRLAPGLGVASVQLEQTELVDLAEMQMKWEPAFITTAGSVVDATTDDARVFYLNCAVDAKAAADLPEEEARRFEYAQPHALLPDIVEQNIDDMKFEEETAFVTAQMTFEGKEIELNYPLAGMTKQQFVHFTAADAGVEPTEEFSKAVDAALGPVVKQERARRDAAKEALRTKLAARPAAMADAIDKMITAKVYPVDADGMLTAALKDERSKVINRFFGSAQKLIDCA